LLIRKRYYVLFLIPVSIVQVAKLVQFSRCNIVSKIRPSTSMHFAAIVRARGVAGLYGTDGVHINRTGARRLSQLYSRVCGFGDGGQSSKE
jgi:hypothetical protein